ncbi:hypothetical protein [Streptomyces acidiscabies]|uniref:Sigma-70 family RNA polymerase sigma factor n=3 Tax=Streptomyces acidiscabies TaxID=42234 RepID=A0ABU4MDE4_9ACTN|nr:hypothetical protein [Streptomyces acidiscabies]MBZ3913706.1 hypothetical protein [Streptomyces acidiscabies]MDX3025911.1 hypothetical protein [Streptomyces acidiscabies]MDX3796835.1 hypothetical protein [Streptomyces acidiscabies]GAQ58492.1 hypothetical protein a10_08382 [Streptomyces acidiscabies]GAV45609.1 hypothetical protein Saa2_08600 [Streptomyces acidiscabies]
MVSSRHEHRRTTPVLPLDTVRERFALLVTEPDPLTVDGHRFHGLPHRPVPLDELRGLLLHPACPRLTRDAVWTHLVRRSRRDGAAWVLACAGMALPALAGVARRLADRFPGEPSDIQAEVLSGFLDGLTSVDVVRPRVLPRLRWAAYRQGHAALTKALAAPTPVAPGFGPSAPRPPWGHPDLVLARAVREAVLTRTEADLIGTTRLDDTTVTDWADRHRTTPNAAYKTRRRAEARLAAFLHDEARSGPDENPAARTAMDALPLPRTVPPGDRRTERAEKSAPGMAKTGPESGLLKCGGSTPPSPSSSAPEAN